MLKKKRVVVAMSGGVDSSVAAALLKNNGFEVIGITMCFNLADSRARRPNCCGIQGIEDARAVAHKLGIRHYVLNMQKVLEEKVVKDFLSEYLRGRTPNPCIRCNQYIKFDALLEKALSLDAAFLATGHYARIKQASGKKPGTRGYLLKKAKDSRKDQSYFLYRLGQKQLRHALFPLGGYTKKEVRRLAKDFGLPVAEKPGSQEICFLPQADYRAFLKQRLGAKIMPGLVVDGKGTVLGRHEGIAFYTVGQRKALGIARGHPLYITRIDARNNRIIAGTKEEAGSCEFLIRSPHFAGGHLDKEIAVGVKIRYNHSEASARAWPVSGGVKVKFKQPQFAVTPGQSAVFYRGDTVLGGGIIDKVFRDEGQV